MALKTDLEGRLKDCKSASDFSMLAIEASKEPADLDFAKELISKAEGMCGLPIDYIKTAEAYFYALKDKDKAEELFEEAAENCFEAIESAELGHSLFVVLGDKEKAKEHLESAAKEAKKVPEIMTISGYILSDLGDEDLAKELMSKVEAELKTYDDFLKTTETLLAQGDKATAKSIFKNASKKVDGIQNTVNYAKEIKEKFDDNDWAKEALEDVVDDAQFTKEFVALAGMYHTLGDEDKCDELIQQGQDFAMQGDEHIILAKAYMNVKKDKDKARESFDKGMKDITDKQQLISLAKDIAAEMQDNELALKFYQQAETKATGFKDFLMIAAEVKTTINDKEYIDGLYTKAENKAESYDEIVVLGSDVHANLEDNDKALGIYDKALTAIQKMPQYFELLKETEPKLNNKDFSRKILDTANEKAESSMELIQIAENVLTSLNDKEYAQSILETAEETVTSLNELKSVDEAVKKYYGDNAEWLKRIVEKIAKREENSAVYDELQQRENKAVTAKEFITLNEDMMALLNDVYYSKKLLTTAENLLKADFFNFNTYKNLIEAIKTHLNNEVWIKKLIDTAYTKRAKFFFDLDNICRAAIKYLSDETQAKNLVLKFTDDFEKKIDESKNKDANDYIKLAVLVFELLEDKDNAKSIISKAESIAETPTVMANIAVGFGKLGLNSEADSIMDKAFGLCKSSEDIFSISKNLLTGRYPADKVKASYLKAKTKVDKGADIIGWITGLIDLFGDYSTAEKEYAAASGKLAPGDRGLLETSRKARIEKDVF